MHLEETSNPACTNFDHHQVCPILRGL